MIPFRHTGNLKERLKEMPPDLRLMVLKQIEELETENKMLKEKIESTSKKVLSLDNIKDNPAEMRYYTSFVNFGTFMALFNYLEPKALLLKYWRG